MIQPAQQDCLMITKTKIYQQMTCQQSTICYLNEGKTKLPANFVPGEFDVICSRGKHAKTHPGNLFLQSIIEQTAPKYGSLRGKIEKSIIVSQIIETVRQKSPMGGGFVKNVGGEQWIEIGYASARERVSQALRDQLHNQYRSSSSSKQRRKIEINSKMNDDLDAFVKSNQCVSNKMESLSNAIQVNINSSSDVQLEHLMYQVNCEILHELKTGGLVVDLGKKS